MLVSYGIWRPTWFCCVALLGFAVFLVKSFMFLLLYVWVRFTLPRFRFDQLMNLGWKVLLPLALVNILITGFLNLP